MLSSFMWYNKIGIHLVKQSARLLVLYFDDYRTLSGLVQMLARVFILTPLPPPLPPTPTPHPRRAVKTGLHFSSCTSLVGTNE